MGNNTSSKPGVEPEVAGGAYSPTSRDENVYDQSFPPAPVSRRYSTSSQTPSTPPFSTNTNNSSRVSPPLPPRGLERRSYTMVSRQEPSPRPSLSLNRRLSTSDMSPPASLSDSDILSTHVTRIVPTNHDKEISLDSKIVVTFDKDVKTVNINKLFEVTCNSVDSSLSTVKGRISYDARQQKAEFIPQSTLYPGSKYTVILVGRAVTTTSCAHSANIQNAEYSFHTCSPQPKNIGMKLKGSPEQLDSIEIANYYDLFNSLIVWSTRKWGCSGEYITGMYTENNDGKLLPLRTDHDVLNLKEKETVIVEIKD